MDVICLNSKGGRSGIPGLQPSLQDRVYSTYGLSFAITTAFNPSILEIKRVDNINRLGQMDNSDGTYESANRVYDTSGLCPTIPTRSNDQVPKIMEIKHLTSKGENECLSRAEQSRAEQSRAEQSRAAA